MKKLLVIGLIFLISSFDRKMNIEECSFRIEIDTSSKKLKNGFKLSLRRKTGTYHEISPNLNGYYNIDFEKNENVSLMINFRNISLLINDIAREKISTKLKVIYSDFYNKSNDSNEKMLRHNNKKKFGKFAYVVFQDGSIKSIVISKNNKFKIDTNR